MKSKIILLTASLLIFVIPLSSVKAAESYPSPEIPSAFLEASWQVRHALTAPEVKPRGMEKVRRTNRVRVLAEARVKMKSITSAITSFEFPVAKKHTLAASVYSVPPTLALTVTDIFNDVSERFDSLFEEVESLPVPTPVPATTKKTSSPAKSTATTPPASPVVVTQAGISREELDRRIKGLADELRIEITNKPSADLAPLYRMIALSQKIDNISNVTITNTTISGGTITASPDFSSALSVSATATSSFTGPIAVPNIQLTGATSTATNGLNISGGCFAINGTCISGGGGAGTPGGSDGQVQYNNGGSFGGGTGFVWDDTNNFLGLGTSTPYTKLAVVGEIVGAYFTGTTTATSTFGGVNVTSGGVNIPTDQSFYVDGVRTLSATSLGAAVVTSVLTSVGALDSGSITTNFGSINTGADTITTTGLGTFGNLLVTASSTLQNFTATRATTTQATTTSLAISSLTLGSIPFVSTGGSLIQNNADLFWDNTNERLGLGTTSPASKLSIVGDILLATSTTVVNPILHTRTNAATTTIGFFVSTSTGFAAGVGLGVPASLKNYIIVGNGKVQAGMGIVNGGLCVDSDGWCSATSSGRVSARALATEGSDVAEIYLADAPIDAGEIVMTKGGVNIERGTRENEGKIIGIISTSPGLLLGLSPDEDQYLGNRHGVALSGRVPTKVNFDGGPIEIGDLISISSTTPGVGMKTQTGSLGTVGVALESFDGSSAREGKILVFVNLRGSQLSSSIKNGGMSPELSVNGGSVWRINEQGFVSATVGPIDLSGFELRNVNSILSSSGKWRIDEQGAFITEEIHAKKLCLEDVCIDKNVLRALLQGIPAAGVSSSPIDETSIIPPVSTEELAQTAEPESVQTEELEPAQTEEATPVAE